MFKKITLPHLIRFVIAFMLAIGVIAVTPIHKSVMITTRAADSGTIGDISWQLSGQKLKIGPTNGVSGTLERWETSGYPWTFDNYITSIDIYGSITLGANSSGLFEGMSAVQHINYLNKFDTSNVTDMSYMFAYCTNLYTVNLTHFDTSNVTDMSYMFYGCNWIRDLIFSFFDTSNVTKMSHMFGFCESMTSLDLSRFNTAKVTNMDMMFNNCTALRNLNIRNFDTSNIKNFEVMFYNCGVLENLDLRAFDTSSAVNMSGMFSNCKSLKTINLSSFDTSGVQNMSGMFAGCESLKSLDISNFDTQSAEYMGNMFVDDAQLETIYVSHRWNTGKASSSDNMFKNCGNLPNFDADIVDKTNAHYRSGGYLTYRYHDFKDGEEPFTAFHLTADPGSVSLDECIRISGTYTGANPDDFTLECSDPEAYALESFNRVPQSGDNEYNFEFVIRMKKPGTFEFLVRNRNLYEAIELTVNGKLQFLKDEYVFVNEDLITLEAKYIGIYPMSLKASAEQSGTFTNISCQVIDTDQENTYQVIVTAKPIARGSCKLTLTDGYETASTNVEIQHKGFSARHDGWPLINMNESFGYSREQNIYLYKYLEAEGDLQQFEWAFEDFEIMPGKRAWDGDSFGLSVLAVAQYEGIIDLSAYFTRNTGFLNTSGYNEITMIRENNHSIGQAYTVSNKDLIAMIERAECSRWSTQMHKAQTFDGDSTYRQLIEHLSADGAVPVITVLKTSHGWHAVVLETMEKPAETEAGVYKIFLYDSNAPELLASGLAYPYPNYNKAKPYILLDTNTGSYEYYYNDALDYSGTYYSRGNVQNISFYDISELDPSVYYEKNSLDSSKTTDFIIADHAVISDEDGRVLFEIDDGEAYCYSESVEFVPDLGSSVSENIISGMVTLPNANYVYSTSGDMEILSFSSDFPAGLKMSGSGALKVDRNNTDILIESEDEAGFLAAVMSYDGLSAAEGNVNPDSSCTIEWLPLYDAIIIAEHDNAEPLYFVDGDVVYPRFYRMPEWEWNDGLTEAYLILNDSEGIILKAKADLSISGNKVIAKAYFKGKEYSDYMYLEYPSEPLTLDPESMSITVDQTRRIIPSVTPVVWESDNESVATVSQNGVVTGIRPGKAVITAEADDGSTAQCLVNVLFTDVADSSQYYFTPVYWAVENGITNGYTDNDGIIRTFKPQNDCTREAVVTFLWRLAGKPEPKSLISPFSDVQDSGKYYYKAVLWAVEQGITKGYADGTFKPNATCLREHVVTFLYRYAGKPNPGVSKNPFNDISSSDYYYNAALWANAKGIAKGYSTGAHAGGFGPKLDCLREHVVTFLYRYNNKYPK